MASLNATPPATEAPGASVAPVGHPGAWRNRIVGSGEEAPDQLIANPANWRTHPGPQRDALRGSLAEVGWVQQVMVNRRTGFVVDGHARVEEALSAGAATVPVLYVDLDPEEEALVLATLDPIAAMANTDDAKLRELLADITVDDAGLAAMLGMFDVSATDAASLASGDRAGFRQMAFIVTDEQAETIEDALRRARAAGPFDDANGNGNGNGNALARVAESYA